MYISIFVLQVIFLSYQCLFLLQKTLVQVPKFVIDVKFFLSYNIEFCPIFYQKKKPTLIIPYVLLKIIKIVKRSEFNVNIVYKHVASVSARHVVSITLVNQQILNSWQKQNKQMTRNQRNSYGHLYRMYLGIIILSHGIGTLSPSFFLLSICL